MKNITNLVIAIILAYIVGTTIFYADTIVWGMDEYGYNAKGVLGGIIEYSDDVYGDSVQNALKRLNSWIIRDEIDSNVVWAFCPFIETYGQCVYIEISEFKG